MNNLKAKCRIILEDKCQNMLQDNYKLHLEMMVVLDTPQDTIPQIASTPISYHSGWIIKLPDKFILLG